ncbi:MAG: recombinase family protein [Nitrosomonas sp.]|nr:recombinase family protein [Nitrosomonas sp.]
MGKIIAYLRASTDKQDLNHQKLELLEFARKKSLAIDDFMEITISSRKTTKQRRVDELVERLNPSDTLMVTELSRLGRSTAEVLALVNTMVSRGIRVIIVKQNLDLDISRQDMNSKMSLTLFSLFAELERDLISLRTKEALASKKRDGKVLGKPKGTIQKSKFDKDVEKIKELLNIGLSVRKITKVLGYKNNISLNIYINKRNLKKIPA